MPLISAYMILYPLFPFIHERGGHIQKWNIPLCFNFLPEQTTNDFTAC